MTTWSNGEPIAPNTPTDWLMLQNCLRRRLPRPELESSRCDRCCRSACCESWIRRDRCRPRVGGLLLLTLLIGGIVVTSLAGLVGLDSSAAQADASTEAAIEDEVQEVDRVELAGVVTDSRARPISGATVRVVRWHWNEHSDNETLATVTSAIDGRFTVTVSHSLLDDLNAREGVSVYAVAHKEGLCWDGLRIGDPSSVGELRFVLPEDGPLLTGRGSSIWKAGLCTAPPSNREATGHRTPIVSTIGSPRCGMVNHRGRASSTCEICRWLTRD